MNTANEKLTPMAIGFLVFILILSGQAWGAMDKSTFLLTLPAVLAVAGAGNSHSHPTTGTGVGRITYTYAYERDVHEVVYRIAAEKGAQPENISAALDNFSPITTPLDSMLNSSPNGEWLVLSTNRFNAECDGWPCLALVKGDLSSATTLMAGGSLIHPEGWSAVSSAGDLVIFTGMDGPHSVDLFATQKNAQGTWSTPVVITGYSSYDCNSQPSISADGNKVVFRCGPTPNDSGSICEVNSDGTGFNIKVTAGQIGSTFLNQPDYTPDGSIVFEEAGNLEQIWRLPSGSSTPVKITNSFTNDNSPCVLPDGRIVSLWIRDTLHELKVMAADGSSYTMVLPGVEIFDVGLGCGL